MIDWSMLLQRSYVPYSGQARATVVLDSQGNAYPGIRIENVSFPLTITASQGAVYHCLSRGQKPHTLLVATEEERSPETDWAKQWDLNLEVRKNIDELSFIDAPSLPENSVQRSEQLDTILYNSVKFAHVPHSNFPVSALLSFENSDQYIIGVNIESDDWRLGLCAERVAIHNALSLGLSEISSIHVYAPQAEYTSPCGACRQVINEHLSSADAVMHHQKSQRTSLPAHQYLPYAFKASSLNQQ
jgi:homotetrameric cytidine deaminase